MLTAKEVVDKIYLKLCEGAEKIDLPPVVVDYFGSTRLRKGYSGVEQVCIKKINNKPWLVGSGSVGFHGYDIFAFRYFGNNHSKTVPRQVMNLVDSGDRFYFNVALFGDNHISIADGIYKSHLLSLDFLPFTKRNGCLLYDDNFVNFFSKEIYKILLTMS